METRDKILEIIKVRGPSLPAQIAKEIGTNILMASAHLAELTASSKLKISTIKVGSSPLYYLPGQESMLQKFTGNMNDKEKKAYDSLGQNKVLRDSQQEPVIRVALREIKDFAIPLNVNYNDKREVFWKWYLASNLEAEQLIKSQLDILEKPAENNMSDGISKQEEKIPRAPEVKKTEPIEKQAKEIIQKDLKEKQNETKKYRPREKEDKFLNETLKFFEKNKINVLSSEIIKKNSETDFIIEIPTPVGNMQYYCKAKNKKRINDSDLSTAYMKGQLKRLPILLLAPGELSTKAQEMIGKEISNLKFKKI